MKRMRHAVNSSSTFGWKPAVVRRMYLFASSGAGAPGAGPSAAPPAATPPPAAAPPAATPTPASTGTGTGGPSGAPSASPPDNTGGLPSNTPNLDVLRSNHEAITRLGGMEAVQAAIKQAGVIQGLRTEASGWAAKLNYTPESFQAAFEADPVGVYQLLQQETAKAKTGAEGDPPDLNRILDDRLGPLEQQIRAGQVEKANGMVDAELSRVLGDHAIFKGANDVPPEVGGFIQDLAREILKYDQAGLQKIMKGDVTPVKAAFDTAIDRMMKAVNSFTQWQTKRGTAAPGASGTPPANGNGTGQPPAAPNWDLSDLINGKENAFQGLGSTRR